MSRPDTLALIERYYAAFNSDDGDTMLACLTDDVTHHINQGSRHVGKGAFRDFLAHMDRCYRECLAEIVIMANDEGTRAAAEFVVHGQYLATDEGLPEAKGQEYVLPAGTFFEIAEGRIARVSVYYNLSDWTEQITR